MTSLRAFSRDDEGSMPLAMLLILISVTLSAVMTPILLSQVQSTRTDVRRVHALHAAQAGIDVAMAYIRNTQDKLNDRIGLLNLLPCWGYTGLGGTPAYEGKVDGSSTARYQVSVEYYKKDPRNLLTTLLDRVSCSLGIGPVETPKFALLKATGTDTGTGAIGSTATRTLTATYVFNITNANIPGGLIHVYRDAVSDDLCMAAESGLPTPGRNLRVKKCDYSDPSQIWIYNQYLMIVLSSTRTTDKPLGMCVEMAAPQTAGKNAVVNDCTTVTQPRQQWSTNDSANLQGTTDGVNLNGTCLVVQSPNVDGSNVVGGTCGGPYNNVHTWSLEARVGAGSAGLTTGQVVNFSQFGRCMDITEVNVNKGYLIVWPCKQAPDPNKVLWNQKFTMPAINPLTNSGTGPVTTTNPTTGVKYCLKSPGSTAPGRYVTVTPCPTIPTVDLLWTFFGHNVNYATSYILVDYQLNCMAPTDPKVDKYGSGENVSKIVMAKCNGSTGQKWNAPPNVQMLFPLKDIHED
jgi:hypothetical protein